MSRGPSLLRGLVLAVLAAVTQGIRAGQKPQAKPQHRDANAPAQATWRKSGNSRASEEQAAATVHYESPGREGKGATRDLTPTEVRAIRPRYEPNLDGEPDPGEVIWTWVPYAERDGRGKDRPVLILARLDSKSWAGCYLSTKEHRGFVSVGTGTWDSQGRESFLSPERVLRVTDEGMRRESTGVDKKHYDRAVQAVKNWHGMA